jgi:hypothetical protein
MVPVDTESKSCGPNLGVDIYNALNSSAVLAVNDAFDAWQRPTDILAARFAKVVLQFNF